ncbi:hypothetical protein CSV71_15035 [Sporosarcina sp. P21c]|uniref:fibronectin type III domain-containing protein n=1 Tax=Sporosarcina sp. P21c TaxID=2048255 RepID=UPI000C16C815|nr:fibronectin type III domain-containing protein [Sporosarcina sp. P21c]PIC88437.1 hypothetical protein CSV71_15035 [Sporosarcina sp. P21c]
MAFLAIINRTQGGATFYVSDLNIGALYEYVYINVDGKQSPNLAEAYNSQTSKWWTVSSLNCGQTYQVFWAIKSKGGSEADGQGSFTTLACSAPIGNVGYISAGQDASIDSRLNVNYGIATNADYYRIRLINTATFGVIRDVTETSRSVTFINIPLGQYIVQVWGEDYSGRGGPSMESLVTMINQSPVPGSPGSVSVEASTTTAGRLYASWGYASGATDYLVTVYYNTGGYVDSAGVYGTSITFSGLIEGRTYYVVVLPRNSNGSGPSRSSSNITMPFVVSAPGMVGSITLSPSTITAGSLFVSWGAATNANAYLISLYRSDGAHIKDEFEIFGNTNISFASLVPNVSYYVVITAYNGGSAGPSRTSGSVKMPVINVRPSNWQWDSTKSSGGALNITSNEWNRFLNRIDAFRSYKGLGSGSYTYASVGNAIAANQYNQARLAISSMGAVPYAVSAGSTIYASEFNQIRDYLNTIN